VVEGHARAAPDAADLPKWKAKRRAAANPHNFGRQSAADGFDFDTSANLQDTEPVFYPNGEIRNAVYRSPVRNKRKPAQGRTRIMGCLFRG
jgi:hypothetical protein